MKSSQLQHPKGRLVRREESSGWRWYPRPPRSSGGILIGVSTFPGALVIATSARIMTYLVTCIALPALRQRREVAAPLFELRDGVHIAIACVVVLTFLLFQSSWTELGMLAGVSAAGVLPWWLARSRGLVEARA